MRKLNDREKKILRLRFFEGRTQMEVFYTKSHLKV